MDKDNIAAESLFETLVVDSGGNEVALYPASVFTDARRGVGVAPIPLAAADHLACVLPTPGMQVSNNCY